MTQISLCMYYFLSEIICSFITLEENAMIVKHCTYKYKVFMVDSQADMMLWNITYIRGKHVYIRG